MTAAPSPWFFLSFATSNQRDDDFVSEFFVDLGHEVRAAAGLRGDRDETGFLSLVTLRLGDDWWERLREQLDRAAVFVALCAPTYFASAACGKEWRSFSDRLAAYRFIHNEPAPCLLPVPWLRDPLPPELSHLQYVDRRLSPVLHETGLRDLMLLKRYRDDYAAFTGALARHIVALARRFPLPPGHTAARFDDQPQAFPAAAPPIPQARPPSRPSPAGPPDLRDDRFPRLQSP